MDVVSHLGEHIADKENKLVILSRSWQRTADVHCDELEGSGRREKLHVVVTTVLSHPLGEAISTSANISLVLSRQMRPVVESPHCRILP